MRRLIIITTICLGVACSEKDEFEGIPDSPNLFEFDKICWEIGDIREFRTDTETLAQRYAGVQGGVTFTGSSTITGWGTLAADFPDFSVRNMGIGGSRLDHIMAFSEDLIFENAPDITVLYIGDNDAFRYNFRTFERMMNSFVANYMHRLPGSALVLLSVKPSPIRRGNRSFYLAVNDLYKSYSIAYEQVCYVDIWSGMDEGDTPSFFLSDALHLNRKGYEYVILQLDPVLRSLVD